MAVIAMFVIITRSYYHKWSAALQYLIRLAQCAIECESIVLVCITFIYQVQHLSMIHFKVL